MKSLSLVVLFVLGTMATLDKPHYNLNDAPALFEKFMKDHGRVYKDAVDKQEHYKAFRQSLVLINELNSQPDNTATFDINYMADYTPEETKHLTGVLRE